MSYYLQIGQWFRKSRVQKESRPDVWSKIFQFIFRGYIAQFSSEEVSGDDALSLGSKIKKVFSNFEERYEIKNNTKKEEDDK